MKRGTMQEDDRCLHPMLCVLYVRAQTHTHTHISLPLLFPSELLLPRDPQHYAQCQFPLTSLNGAGLSRVFRWSSGSKGGEKNTSLLWYCTFV